METDTLNFYPRYVGDYARDTADLTFYEDAAYNRLLDHYYATERALPDDFDRLYAIARARRAPELAAVRAVAARFFPVGPDGLRHNKRADKEITTGLSRIEIARQNGRNGGRPPKPSGLAGQNPPGSGPKTQRVNSPPPTPENNLVGGGPGDSVAQHLARAVNAAFDAKFGEDMNPLIATSQGGTTLAAAVVDHGIPIEFATRELHAMALKRTERVSSLSYFEKGLVRAWQRAQARADAKGATYDPPATFPRRGKISSGGDALDEWEDEVRAQEVPNG